ncbi:hypothetical protein [Kineosporia sp. R_H_3]|uniref:hypothetical protein n=1 Tax=Kineosporia sp. R_H_3 TaxID=1961848 RepID=UPI000B4B7787|nr:hypothetical protein [Kineosporia sp. R_H_3]
MTSRASGSSPSESSGGDDARALYDTLTDDLLYDPAIGRATMMGYPCVRLAGRFLASYDDRTGCLVVKLPRERVRDLIDSGDGEPFAPAGRVFREWISIPAVDRDLWQAVLAEAVDFARESLGDRP